jgi:hypothetical protein
MSGSWRLKQAERSSELTPSVTLAELLDYLHNADTAADDDRERDTLWQLAARQESFEFMKEPHSAASSFTDA